MKQVDMSVAAYWESLDAKHRPVLETLIAMVDQTNLHVEGKVWQDIFWGGSQQNILGFGEMVYRMSSDQEGGWFIVGLSRQKNDYSLYVSATKNGQYLLKEYQDKLGKVKASSINFTQLQQVNLDQLLALLVESLVAVE